MQTHPIPICCVPRSLNPTQNYAVVNFSFNCKNRNTDMLLAHIRTVCDTHGYSIEENSIDDIRQRFSVLISNSKTIGESEFDIMRSMDTLSRKLTDKLSVSLEEIQEDAIVWYTKIHPITETIQ